MGRTLGCMVLLLVTVGCGGAHRTSLPHPAMTGSLAPATVTRRDTFGERNLGLEAGALNDDVTLVRLDAQGICFDVMLRGSDQQLADVDLTQASAIQLTTNDVEEPWVAPTVSPRQTETGVTTGTEYVQQDTGLTDTVCVEQNEAGTCLRYEQQRVYQTVGVAVARNVHVGGASICFANMGQVTPHTRDLRLLINDGRYTFELEGAADEDVAAQWPNHPIVAPGYEFLVNTGATSGGEAPVMVPVSSPQGPPPGAPPPPAAPPQS